MIQMFGQPYDFNTLKTVPPSEEARMNRVSAIYGDAFLCSLLLKHALIFTLAELFCLQEVLPSGETVSQVASSETQDVLRVCRGRRTA